AFREINPRGIVKAGGRERRVVTTSEELEQDPVALPLSPFLSEMRQLGDDLMRPGELLPLVVAVHAEGQFRTAVAIWVSGDKQEAVGRFERLEALLGTWDGRFVEAGTWIHAEGVAKKRAQELVRGMVE